MLTIYISGKGVYEPFVRICLAMTIKTSPKVYTGLIKNIKKNPRQFFMSSVDKVTVVRQTPVNMDISVNKNIRMGKPRRVK